MKTLLLAASAAFAALAMSPAASAAPLLCPGGTYGNQACSFSEADQTGSFSNTFSKGEINAAQGSIAFDDLFDIDLTGGIDLLNLSITLTNTLGPSDALNISAFQLLGLNASPIDLLGAGALNAFVVAPGTYTLRVAGSTMSPGTYTGTIDVAAVPEPASWAMLIVGIAAVGVSMRRHSRQLAYVSFS